MSFVTEPDPDPPINLRVGADQRPRLRELAAKLRVKETHLARLMVLDILTMVDQRHGVRTVPQIVKDIWSVMDNREKPDTQIEQVLDKPEPKRYEVGDENRATAHLNESKPSARSRKQSK